MGTVGCLAATAAWDLVFVVVERFAVSRRGRDMTGATNITRDESLFRRSIRKEYALNFPLPLHPKYTALSKSRFLLALLLVKKYGSIENDVFVFVNIIVIQQCRVPRTRRT